MNQLSKAKSTTKQERPTLPDDVTAAGWRLEYDNLGWCKAIHDEKGLVTNTHFPSPHRGLKFVLCDIDRLLKQEAASDEETNFVEQCLNRPEGLGYLEWHEKAEQLHKQGIRQTHCRHCQRWRFPNEHMADDRCVHFEASTPQPRAG